MEFRILISKMYYYMHQITFSYLCCDNIGQLVFDMYTWVAILQDCTCAHSDHIHRSKDAYIEQRETAALQICIELTPSL